MTVTVQDDKSLAVAVTALSLVADEINSFEDPEALKKYLTIQNSRPVDEQQREVLAIIAKARKLVSRPS